MDWNQEIRQKAQGTTDFAFWNAVADEIVRLDKIINRLNGIIGVQHTQLVAAQDVSTNLATALQDCVTQFELVLPACWRVHDERQALIAARSALAKFKAIANRQLAGKQDYIKQLETGFDKLQLQIRELEAELRQSLLQERAECDRADAERAISEKLEKALKDAQKHHMVTSLPQAIEQFGSLTAAGEFGKKTWFETIPSALAEVAAMRVKQGERE